MQASRRQHPHSLPYSAPRLSPPRADRAARRAQLHRRYDLRPPQLRFSLSEPAVGASPPGPPPASAPGTPHGWVGPEGADAWFEFLHGPGGPGRVRGASEVSLAGSEADAREADARSVRSAAAGWGAWWDGGAAVRARRAPLVILSAWRAGVAAPASCRVTLSVAGAPGGRQQA